VNLPLPRRRVPSKTTPRHAPRLRRHGQPRPRPAVPRRRTTTMSLPSRSPSRVRCPLCRTRTPGAKVQHRRLRCVATLPHFSPLMVRFFRVQAATMSRRSRTRTSRPSSVTSSSLGLRSTRSSRRASGQQEGVRRSPPLFFLAPCSPHCMYRPHRRDSRSAEIGTALQRGH
jgi:hypothetical protein